MSSTGSVRRTRQALDPVALRERRSVVPTGTYTPPVGQHAATSGPPRQITVEMGRAAVAGAQATHRYLTIDEGLAEQTKQRHQARDTKADTLVLVAEPDIEVREAENGERPVEVKGFDSYNPATGQVTPHEGIKEIECLIIDTNDDGAAWFARAIHFPA